MLRVTSGDRLPLKSLWINDVEHTPDSGNVIVTCSDQTGSVVSAQTVAFDADIGIPQGLLVVSSNQTLSFFNLKVEFTAEGQSYTYRDIIRVHTDYMLIYGPADIRSLLGAREEELPDSDIDLYFSLSQTVSEYEFDVETEDFMTVNELVKYHEALRQLDSLPLKILQKEEIGDSKETRYSKLDLESLRSRLSGRYETLRASLSTTAELGNDLLVEFVTRDDIITGA